MAKQKQELQIEPTFVSQQVTDARRYYLNLNPNPNEPLSVVCGGVERMRPEYVVSRIDFPFYAIELVVEGEGSLNLNGKMFPLGPGSVFAYGPGVQHIIQNDPQNRMRKYYVDLSGKQVDKLLQETGLIPWRVMRIFAIHEFIDLFQTLDREAREDSSVSVAVCETLARLLMLKLKQRTVANGGNLPRSFETYQRIRTHLEKNYLRLNTIEEAAQECHVSSIYLSRLFKKYAGAGAYQFLLRLKMNSAAELLLDEGLLVKQVATYLGYPDPFQFSRAFKRVYGVPPKQLLDSRHLR
ncbi:AraC family transcriptional regulator [Rubinisphaera sp.]|uniref:AraC family transcriptional regulator n=1 Tax=Rubinisphaera sp. TaxID=2024857 RepID=UPI000C0EE7EC|nr:AraC family transcriptional regulator [Rubinisphaera sp.]MBV09564.1 AraC family transcriptional regulator [Rubinisphaera sp.]HCS51904.1 AraC family transcriptional regulator [Planctomycetaceae bacterium]|tara:strand:+ start:114 stop:1001 length:888 start_codon:yes stop_codon:yes gene_type:complete